MARRIHYTTTARDGFIEHIARLAGRKIGTIAEHTDGKGAVSIYLHTGHYGADDSLIDSALTQRMASVRHAKRYLLAVTKLERGAC